MVVISAPISLALSLNSEKKKNKTKKNNKLNA